MSNEAVSNMQDLRNIAEAKPEDRPLHDLLSHHMVDIYVGPDNTHYVLHEKLLCSKSKFFSKIFYTPKSSKMSKNQRLGLPDEEDAPFRLFVGWLYSGRVPSPEEENELGDLFELYLMGEKWQIASLIKDVSEAVRRFYRMTETFPGLRRVQYVYANTTDGSPMRQLLISSIARMLIVGESIPAHWEKALRKNGELVVDIIKAMQAWKLDPESIPDARKAPQKVEKHRMKEAERSEKELSTESADEMAQGMTNGDEHHE